MVLATVAFGLWSAGRPRGAITNYDGVVVAFGTFASVPVQIAVLAFAAQLRRWPPALYLGLVVPRRAEVIVAVIAILALNLTFDAHALDQRPRSRAAVPGRGLADRRGGGLARRRCSWPSSWSRRSARRSPSAASCSGGWRCPGCEMLCHRGHCAGLGFAAHPVRLAGDGADFRGGAGAGLVSLGHAARPC